MYHLEGEIIVVRAYFGFTLAISFEETKSSSFVKPPQAIP